MSEDDTRVKLIDPKLHASGWKEENIKKSQIQEKHLTKMQWSNNSISNIKIM